MNFLAHIYLSGDDEGLILGNFIGDYIKGSKYLDYPENIQKGILLHRKIDVFTDNHPVAREASRYFKQEYRRYSGIVTDVIFDHFLASEWHRFATEPLRDFTRNAYAIFFRNFMILPSRVKQFLPFMIQGRRLESYATEKGLYKALELMAHYTSLPDKQESVLQVLHDHKPELLRCFYGFMNDVISYAENDSGVIIKKPAGFKFNSDT